MDKLIFLKLYQSAKNASLSKIVIRSDFEKSKYLLLNLQLFILDLFFAHLNMNIKMKLSIVTKKLDVNCPIIKILVPDLILESKVYSMKHCLVTL